MVLKTFILYFAPFLIGSFALFAAIRQYAPSFAALGKRPMIYGALSALIFSGLAFGATFMTTNLFLVFWIIAALFLLFGLIHLKIAHKRYFSHKKEPKSKLFYAELMYAITIFLFSMAAFAAFQYFGRDKDFLFYPVLLSLIFFFVPFLLSNTFAAAFETPEPIFSTWQYPLLHPIELPEEKEGERVYVIGFEVAKKDSDAHRTFFRAKAPEDILLGDLYYHFINDYNELQSETPIQYINPEGAAQEWHFRTKPKWHQRSRILDASQTIKDVGIRENTVIICERVSY